jgi:hypothetical protein
MPEFVHVAKILPGGREEFLGQIKAAFESAGDGLKTFGFTRVRSFFTPETIDRDADGLLVTIYEADDPDVITRFYEQEVVIEQEEQAHGRLVVAHNHDAVPTNTPFVDVDLT